MGVKDTTRSLAEKTVGNIRQISEGKAPPGHCPYVLGVLTNGTFSREYKMLSDLRSAIVSHNGSVIKVMQEQFGESSQKLLRPQNLTLTALLWLRRV